MVRKLKLVLTGDAQVGKTSLLIADHCKAPIQYPPKYTPKIMDNFPKTLTMDGEECSVMIFDTDRQEDYEHIRKALHYRWADVVLLAFSISDRDSLHSVRTLWLPEAQECRPGVACLLVGLKADVRTECGSEVCQDKVVSLEEARGVARSLGLKYVETSAVTYGGVRECFNYAIRVAIAAAKSRSRGRLHFLSRTRSEKDVLIPPVEPPVDPRPEVTVESSTLAQDWHKALQDPHFSDLTFVVGGKGEHQLHTHKIVVCSASPFFRKVLGGSVNDGFTMQDLNSGQINGISAVYHHHQQNDNLHNNHDHYSNLMSRCSEEAVSQNEAQQKVSQCATGLRLQADNTNTAIINTATTTTSSATFSPSNTSSKNTTVTTNIAATTTTTTTHDHSKATTNTVDNNGTSSNTTRSAVITIKTAATDSNNSAATTTTTNTTDTAKTTTMSKTTTTATNERRKSTNTTTTTNTATAAAPDITATTIANTSTDTHTNTGANTTTSTSKAGPTGSTTVVLSGDVQLSTFQRVLEFLYTGQPMLPEDMTETEIGDVCRVSDIFGLGEMTTFCCNVMNGDGRELNPSLATFVNSQTAGNLKDFYLNKPESADVVFNVQGTSVYAHRVVLAARCDVMAAMFREGHFSEGSQPVAKISIPNCSVETFLAFLEYLYTDRAPIEQGDGVGILMLADEYCVTRLCSLCELYISKEIVRRCCCGGGGNGDKIQKCDVDVIALLNSAERLNARQLVQQCLHLVSTNYAAFDKRKELSALSQRHRQHVEEHQWPPLWYLQEMEDYERKTRAEKEQRTCVLM